MSSLNKCCFIGRIGQDPEKRSTPSGKSVTSFSLAVSEKYNGNEKTTWLRCQAWEKLSDVIANYCHKGSLLYIEATFQINEWTDKEGAKKQTPEFTVRLVKMLDSKKDSQQQNQYPQQNNQVPQSPQSHYVDGAQPNAGYIEDDIPF